jgi:hypothetical protein
VTYRTSLLSLSLSLLAVAACGGGNNDPDAPPSTTPDSPPIDPPDAKVCDAAGYPEKVRMLSVDLISDTTLTLDGTGPRCEQLLRALTGETTRPPELADMDAEGYTGSCTYDDVLDVDVVRVRLPLYDGIPMFYPPQDMVVHVEQNNHIRYLHGDFFPVGNAPRMGCLTGDEAASELRGDPLGYLQFSLCVPGDPGEYIIAADDELDIGAEGYLQDADGFLRRVRSVDVYLLPDHVTPAIGNSDAFCCTGPTLEHCVGAQMFVDVLTGETVWQAPHCHTC